MKTVQKILEEIRKQSKSSLINEIWCQSLDVEDKNFNRVDLFVEHNVYNYIININIKFYNKDTPDLFYLGKIPISSFKTEEDLKNLIQKHISSAAVHIAELKSRSNQYTLFN